MVSGAARPSSRGQGTHRFVTATDSVAAPRSEAEPEKSHAITRTVLPDQGRRTLGSITALIP